MLMWGLLRGQGVDGTKAFKAVASRGRRLVEDGADDSPAALANGLDRLAQLVVRHPSDARHQKNPVRVRTERRGVCFYASLCTIY